MEGDESKMILSFGWTADYLPPKRCKDTTRRIWSDRTFKAYLKAWDEGRYWHEAVDKQLCFKGKYIGRIKLIERPFKEAIAEMTSDELIREGGMVDTVDEFIDKYFKGDKSLVPVVVRFKFVPSVIPKPKQLSLLEMMP
jgi:hypothetical protein